MNPEISQRLGAVFASAQWLPDPNVRDYILQSALKATTWDDLPLDVQVWITEMEAEYAIHPAYVEKANQETQQIDEQMP